VRGVTVVKEVVRGVRAVREGEKDDWAEEGGEVTIIRVQISLLIGWIVMSL